MNERSLKTHQELTFKTGVERSLGGAISNLNVDIILILPR